MLAASRHWSHVPINPVLRHGCACSLQALTVACRAPQGAGGAAEPGRILPRRAAVQDVPERAWARGAAPAAVRGPPGRRGHRDRLRQGARQGAGGADQRRADPLGLPLGLARPERRLRTLPACRAGAGSLGVFGFHVMQLLAAASMALSVCQVCVAWPRLQVVGARQPDGCLLGSLL